MRTRLDEIVEEERGRNSMKSYGWFDGPKEDFCLRIAERAFRHGVEQGLLSHREFTKTFEVQPAPAVEREKCPISCERPKGHEGQCSITIRDRRKGQRRRGLEQRLRGTAYLGPTMERTEQLYCTSAATGWGEWRNDRRSGNDRRKKA